MKHLKANQLKEICRVIGAPSSGTKSVLVNSIAAQRSALTRRQLGSTLVSVDLGLKNIGVCKMNLSQSDRPVISSWDLVNLGSPPHAYPGFAVAAAELADRLMLGTDGTETPSTVLIERQRSRSAGAAAVPHDILRINVLEGMLHTALLCSHPHVQVVSIDPKSILAYWRDTLNLPKTQTYRESKKLRLNLVSGWLAAPDAAPFILGPSVTARSRGKKDDLDDALTQAITWTQWQKHAAALVFDKETL